MERKKLIEVALPLDAINAESAREKSIRHGHPSTLHLWWARRPLATARAVIWSSLVDDPSAHPEQFPTEELQTRERERLFGILTRLVKWENSNNESVLAEAKAEIAKSNPDGAPALLDPFAGGGAIPLEAQRLGLEAHAHDLNPVAVMINKAMIEIPPKFAGRPPVNPRSRAQIGHGAQWQGAAGLAEDVRYYGEWMKEEAYKRIGHLYPTAKLTNGKEVTVIAWIWARTVKCPNPACGCTIPLTSSYILSKKSGKCAWVVPVRENEHFTFRVGTGTKLPKIPAPKKTRGACFVCPACGTTTEDAYVKQEAQAGNIGAQLMAIVAEGERGRLYLPPNTEHVHASEVEKPEQYPSGAMPENPRWFSPPAFGMTDYSDLFTNRQLTALTTFSALVGEAQKKAEGDAEAAGMFNDHISISEGGTGARAYGEAVGVYLAFIIDKLADRNSAICSWINATADIRPVFARQAIPMVWDFAEANPFSTSVGCFSNMVVWVCNVLQVLMPIVPGFAKQFDAQSDCGFRNIMVSTDPPYYDNIGYADLSDFYYIWMRQSLKETYPRLFNTMLVPKVEELIATPYRHEGDMNKAKEFFEDGMYQTCCQIYKYAHKDLPVSIYYAFKQSETKTDENNRQQTASSGWETMLSAIIRSGFAITGTWPMRTERIGRPVGNGTNALASSIVLVCRKRPEDARSVTRREFINALHREMRPALEKLQFANIAPVDLAQSAIGPGIGVFSRYQSVLEADGNPMTVRSALMVINQELDQFYNEQEGELDSMSRFCVDLFTQRAYNEMSYGEAEVLAKAKGIGTGGMAAKGILYAAKGKVRLLTRDELPDKVDAAEGCIWLLTQQLARAMEKGGIKACAEILQDMYGANVENAKALAYRLYTICERRNWAQEGYAYNNLVVAWTDIQSMAADLKAAAPQQLAMDI
jgi:putative DNA methylase